MQGGQLPYYLSAIIKRGKIRRSIFSDGGNVLTQASLWKSTFG